MDNKKKQKISQEYFLHYFFCVIYLICKYSLITSKRNQTKQVLHLKTIY